MSTEVPEHAPVEIGEDVIRHMRMTIIKDEAELRTKAREICQSWVFSRTAKWAELEGIEDWLALPDPHSLTMYLEDHLDETEFDIESLLRDSELATPFWEAFIDEATWLREAMRERVEA